MQASADVRSAPDAGSNGRKDPGYWYSRFVFERALALIYLVAFVNAANQFVPLVGARGLLPATRFVQSVPFAASPSLFYAIPKDPAFRAAAWLGIAGSCLILTGIPQRLGSIAAGLVVGGSLVPVSLLRQRGPDILCIRLGVHAARGRLLCGLPGAPPVVECPFDDPDPRPSLDALPRDVRGRPDQAPWRSCWRDMTCLATTTRPSRCRTR